MPAWQTSTRRDRLPPDWDRIRKRVGRRDSWSCQWLMDSTRAKCGRPANEVDHIKPGDDHSEANLRCLCSWHHAKKSSAEGNAARKQAAAQRRRSASKFVRTEDHPGSL